MRDREPDPGPGRALGPGADALGRDGQVDEMVQVIGVDAILAGFIAWLAWQPPGRLTAQPIAATPAATRRRHHRAVERFLRWHHRQETGSDPAAYQAALRRAGAGEAELTLTRRALALLTEYAQTTQQHRRWTP